MMPARLLSQTPPVRLERARTERIPAQSRHVRIAVNVRYLHEQPSLDARRFAMLLSETRAGNLAVERQPKSQSGAFLACFETSKDQSNSVKGDVGSFRLPLPMGVESPAGNAVR